jgi:hypothetical protein
VGFCGWRGTIANTPSHLWSSRLAQSKASARSHHWLRAVVYGFLAEFATVLTIILIVMIYRYVFARDASPAEVAVFGVRTGEVVGIVGGTLYTFLFARVLMARLSANFVPHGLLVAVTAIAFSVGGSILGHRGVPAGYGIASALKLLAGALAGFLERKRAAAVA